LEPNVRRNPLRGVWQRFLAFLFPAENDTWLAVFRIGLGVQVTLYALFLSSDWHNLFASSGKGLVGRDVGEAISSFDSAFIPKLHWLIEIGRHLNVGEEAMLTVTWVALLSAGGLLSLGLLSRPAAIAAWFLHLCAAESGGLLAYGADNFMTTALFYLMLSPIPDRYSIDQWVTQRKEKNPVALGFWRRVLQVNLCFVYFVGGLAKFLGSGWWNGTNLWRALIRPPFNLISPDVLIHFRYILPLLGISIFILELGYPAFIWLKSTQRIWLASILAMHAAIGLLMGLYLFALVMIVMNVAAFGVPVASMRERTKSGSTLIGKNSDQ
jgi:Vitamin K-dependent gamma-carboxylase